MRANRGKEDGAPHTVRRDTSNDTCTKIMIMKHMKGTFFGVHADEQDPADANAHDNDPRIALGLSSKLRRAMSVYNSLHPVRASMLGSIHGDTHTDNTSH